MLERIGSLTYRLQLPARARIHDVFHIAFLKKYTDAEPAAIAPLPLIVSGAAAPTGGARSSNGYLMGSVGEVAEQFASERIVRAAGSIQEGIPKFST
jgi:hypothetical protein